MPYIRKEEREEIDREIDAIVLKLKDVPLEKLDGRLNYVITRLLIALYPPSYFNYNRAMGVLACVMQEFYRRFIAPYEDLKIKEHGDIV